MPNWEHFQAQHVLNPVKIEGAPGSWGRREWNNFLQKRIGAAFGSKNTISVIIASPERILQDFETLNDHVSLPMMICTYLLCYLKANIHT